MGDGYPDDWDRRRKKVYQRDGYQCQRCGASGGGSGNAELHAHHKVPKSKGGSHRLSNLTTLCSDCHSQVHAHAVGGNTSSGSSYSSDSTSDHPAVGIFFLKFFFIYLVGALPTGYAAVITGVTGVPAWMCCLPVVSILTFNNNTTKSAIIYTIYGILLCIVVPFYIDISNLFSFTRTIDKLIYLVDFYPAVIVVLTVLLDFTASLIIDDHDHLPTRLT